jgi:hypothetical protein
MNQLTIQILVHNNIETIEQVLTSLLPLESKILIGDLGCKDDTIKICDDFKAQIVPISLNNDFSKARNSLNKFSNTAWNFYVNANETLISDKNIFFDLLKNDPKIYKTCIVSGDVITCSNRIWHKNISPKFINPVFEYLAGKGNHTDIYLSEIPIAKHLQDQILEDWFVKNSWKKEAIYYKACNCLKNNQYDSFLNYADLYFLQELEQSMSYIMTSYYYSMVQLYMKKDAKKAIQYILPCLAKKPSMAEFWCLAADIYYLAKEYEKAQELYENAILCGSQRLRIDDYPLEISKYKEYPEKMVEACKNIIRSSKFYRNNHQN